MVTKNWMCVAVVVAALSVAGAAQAAVVTEALLTDASTDTWGLATNPSNSDLIDQSDGGTWTVTSTAVTSTGGQGIYSIRGMAGGGQRPKLFSIGPDPGFGSC